MQFKFKILPNCVCVLESLIIDCVDTKFVSFNKLNQQFEKLRLTQLFAFLCRRIEVQLNHNTMMTIC